MIKKLLLEKREMLAHNLLCLSSNYAMTMPKKGFESEWHEVKQELEEIETELKKYE